MAFGHNDVVLALRQAVENGFGCIVRVNAVIDIGVGATARSAAAFQRVAGNGGAYRARQDHADANAVGFFYLGSQGLEVADNSVLGAAVACAHRCAEFAGNRADHRQLAAALFDQARQQQLGQGDRSQIVDVDQLTINVKAGVQRQAALADAGVVDQQVNATLPCPGLLHQLWQTLVVGSFKGQYQSAFRCQRSQLLQRLDPAAGQNDGGAVCQ